MPRPGAPRSRPPPAPRSRPTSPGPATPPPTSPPYPLHATDYATGAGGSPGLVTGLIQLDPPHEARVLSRPQHRSHRDTVPFASTPTRPTTSTSAVPKGASIRVDAYRSPRVTPWLTITTGFPASAARRTNRSPDITVSDDPNT